jgi:phage terminase small subunit
MARPAKRDPVAPPKRRRGNQPVSVHTPLTRLQELFVKELVSKDGQITMREAAINAGFAASGAHTRAYEMTNPHICPHVVAAIRAYRDELDMKYGINYKRHIRDLQIIRDMALQNGAYSAAVHVTPEGKSNSGNRGKARERLLETDEGRNVEDPEEADDDEA